MTQYLDGHSQIKMLILIPDIIPGKMGEIRDEHASINVGSLYEPLFMPEYRDSRNSNAQSDKVEHASNINIPCRPSGLI